ncbi:MAG: ribonuclease P protein component [Lachnospiraceae bacterium]|nr:ribonuclease P protein component [Lachnospiraceae bacterium]
MIFTDSLKSNQDFRTVYKNGRSFANSYLVVYLLENNSDRNRLGISVSKKVGNSVVRHHLKRLIKESYRLHENMFNSGLNIVVIARAGAGKADFHKIESALLHVMRLHNVIIK